MQQQTKQKTGIARLLEIAGSKKWWLLLSMLLSVLATLAQFVPIYSIYEITKELARSAGNIHSLNQPLIWHWAWISLSAFICYAVLLYASLMLSHVAAFNILYELRIAITKKLSRLPLGFFSRKSSGNLKKIMSEDVERIELFVAHHIPDITAAIIFPLVIMLWIFFVNWQMALVVLIIFIASFAMLYGMMGTKKGQQVYTNYAQALSDVNGNIVEYVRAMQVIKVFNNSLSVYDKLTNSINSYGKILSDMAQYYSSRYLAFLTLLFSPLLFIAPVGVYLLTRQGVDYQTFLPNVLFFFILGTSLTFPLIKLTYITGFMNQNLIGIAKIDEILYAEETEIQGQNVELKNYDIEFINVSFRYEENAPLAVENVSFLAESGTVTALVGGSGAGKSTIALLASHFWKVSSGEIRLGGHSIEQIPSKQLMDSISFVFQDNLLFFDTIEENIRMGNNQATTEQVIAAAKAAQCHEFIEQLSEGYQTKVGEGGTYLSGGEQQRIAIARAILKDSPVVLLDEATAFADPENETKILTALSKLIQNKTVIIIAHRLRTITNAAQIIVFEQGKIIESGTHQQLLEKQAQYAKMWDIYQQSGDWTLSN